MTEDSIPTTRNSEMARSLVLIAAAAVLYYAAARVGLLLAFEYTNASPVWPPSGIAFALLLLAGTRLWPGIFLGAFVANLVVFTENTGFAATQLITPALTIAGGNTLEALAGVWLLHWLTDRADFPWDIRQVGRFILTAGMMSSISSLIGCATLIAAGFAPTEMAARIWFTWWLGDTTGILSFTPLILAWWPRATSHLEHKVSPIRLAVILGTTLLISSGVFLGYWLPVLFASSPYLVVPLLLWAAYTCGYRGGTSAFLIVGTIAVIGTVNGLGSFSSGDTDNALLLLQTFIVVAAITTLMLAAAITERDSWASALTDANEKLEENISQRTLALTRTNTELVAYREHLEDLVAQRTRQLEDSNQELEAFSYAVSHDLRAPLRSIDGFSHALMDEFQPTLGAAGLSYLARVRASAQRMSQQIEDMLELSRVTRQPIKRASINLSNLVGDVFATLRQQDPERDLNFQCDCCLQVSADPTLLRLVLENLLGNAWKYSRDRSPAEIRFECLQQEGEMIYRLSDNGVGFDMKYTENLFIPFQRLHGSDFEGHGIGLATVARIIKRHGGRIWGEGSVGEGAIFAFTIGNEE